MTLRDGALAARNTRGKFSDVVLAPGSFALRTLVQYDLVVRPEGGELDEEQRRAAREVALVLQTGVEWNQTELVELATHLGGALDCDREAGPLSKASEDQLLRVLRDALESGRLLAVPFTVQPLREREEDPTQSIPPPPPRSQQRPETFFEVRFVDEIGQPVNGLDVLFDANGEPREATTNAAGVALLEGVLASSASVQVADVNALAEILEPRWANPRTGVSPRESNRFDVVFDLTDVGPFPLKAAVPHLVVVKPPLGRIFLELWDKTGTALHRGVDYTIDGPVSFTGTTDENGRLLHEQVPAGDYTLTLDVPLDEQLEQPSPEHYELPAVVLGSGAPAQVRMLASLPRCTMARLRGLLFDKNKTFLLPSALEGLKYLRALYDSFDPGYLLIVGHTDTTGEPNVNDPLSLARAKSMEAFLKDDADVWLANYQQSGPSRWGAHEDRLMLLALPDADELTLFQGPDLGPSPSGNEPRDRDLLSWFQRSRGLTVDGVAGPETRRRLITEYMALDGVSLAEGDQYEISVTTHGCGENFPLDATGLELDTRAVASRDAEDDPIDRRVELFFFDPDFGIVPKPPGPNSKAGDTQYLEWRKRALDDQDFVVEGNQFAVQLIEVEDAHFRTNSAVLMPGGLPPSGNAEARPSGVDILATALRHSERAYPKKLLVAGHTDTEGSRSSNLALSRERAELSYTLLVGERDRFAVLADQRHTNADQKQILAWCSAELPEFFSCDPGPIEDGSPPQKAVVEAFQSQYNAHKAELGVPEADNLEVDGTIGVATWRAMFDTYEYALRAELEVDGDGLADLRAQLVFLASDLGHVGFGESHPIDTTDRDGFRSETNRRAEILFFDPGHEPNLDVLRNDPEHSEVYDSKVYAMTPIPVTGASNASLHMRVMISVEAELPWTDEDILLVFNQTNETALEAPIASGRSAPGRRIFDVPGHTPGNKYRAEVDMKGTRYVLFDQTGSSAGADQDLL